MTLRAFSTATAAALVLVACVQAPPAPLGLMDIAERPAEKALLGGIRAYEDAQYGKAEADLNTALQAGLVSARDRAAVHKYLAFVYCSSQRERECESEFRLARAADPGFVLSRSEAGHPVWGPVYKRLLP